MNKTRILTVVTIAAIFAGLMLGASRYRELFRYELTISNDKEGAALHALQLGEYYTPVKELTIKDSKQRTILRLVSKSADSRMHTMRIEPGLNKFSDMYLDGYFIEGADYLFQKNEEYTVCVTWPSKVAKLAFFLK
jgi:hypothetical protein